MVTHNYIDNTVDDVVLVSLDTAKLHLRIDPDLTVEDTLIESYVAAATVAVQNYMDRSIFTRDFIMECDSFDTVEFAANWDNDEVTKIEYYPYGETDLVTLDPASYKLQKSATVGCWVVKFLEKPALSDRDDAVIITVKQGWVADEATIANAPKPFTQAILLTLSEYYEIRENRTEVPATAAMGLLRPYRRW